MALPTSGTSASGRKILSEQEWKAQAKKDAVEPNIMLVKEGTVLRAAGGSKNIQFVLSTQDVDRAWGGGDTIRPDGWDWKNYEKNPVVLWSHDGFTPAIGRSTKIWLEDGKLMGEVEFASDIHPLAKLVEDLIRGGFVNACSVGFNPKKWVFNSERGDWAADYLEQELLEWSPCNIPCNPNALVAAKSAGLDLKAAKNWAEEILAKTEGPGLYLSRESLQRMELSLGTKRIVDLGAATKGGATDPTAALVPAIKRHRKDGGEGEDDGCSEPCCQPATFKTDDRVKVGDRCGTVKAMHQGHSCSIEFDDATGSEEWMPQDKCVKTDEPKPEAEADKTFTLDELKSGLADVLKAA